MRAWEVRGARARLRPQLPSHWPQIILRWQRAERRHEFIVCAAAETGRIEQALASGATRLRSGVWIDLDDPLLPTRHLVVMSAMPLAVKTADDAALLLG